MGETFDLLNEDDSFQVGHTRYTTGGGSTVTLEWMAEDELGPAENQCAFTGHAMQSG